jgi:hypothetical protein
VNLGGLGAGTALIQLSGPFSQASVGGNHLGTLVLTDSGVQVSATFAWMVYSSGSLRLATGSGTFPAVVIGA